MTPSRTSPCPTPRTVTRTLNSSANSTRLSQKVTRVNYLSLCRRRWHSSSRAALFLAVFKAKVRVFWILWRALLSAILAATPEPQTPGPSFQTSGLPEYLPITVTITYSLRNPVDGFQFVVPTDSYPYVSCVL